MSKSYDPKMHSAEHLLNQAMVSKFGCDRCFSAHINKKKSKCDYYFERSLTKKEVDQLQESVNAQIEKDLPVIIEMMPVKEAKKQFNIERVPEKEGLNDLRIVRMGDYDACPCVGPHVNSTSEIGSFKITTTGFENGVLRIRFKLV
jgi:misacylated tRNA(Ala) deacylase